MMQRAKIKLVYGVGINDADYSVNEYAYVEGVHKRVWRCPFYIKWSSMLERCYYELYTVKRPTYEGCFVCDDWLYFSKFRDWMITQDWEDKQLDKDLLVPDNKEYSPSTCIFVEPQVNTFLTERNALRGDYPIGVSLDKRSGLFASRCSNFVTNKSQWLGYYDTPEEACEVWLAFKLEQAKILASQQTDQRVAKALINKYENYVI